MKAKTLNNEPVITQKEAVTTISSDKKLLAIIYRDPISKKTIMYAVKEMDEDDIAEMMKRSAIDRMYSQNGGSTMVVRLGDHIETVDDTKPDETV